MIGEPFENGLQEALRQGVNSLSRQQTIVFQQYQKYVFEIDGYVFWTPTGNSMTVSGSLHYGTEQVQEEDQTIGINSVIFTSLSEITTFNTLNNDTLWIAEWQVPDGESIKIAFSRRGSYYQQAGLFHYAGFAVYPALESQIIGGANQLPVGPIVSNSLPIWLSLSQYAPVYPSFLVADNISPPYITAHIEPEFTTTLQGFPQYTWPGNPSPLTNLQPMASTQLMKDRVKLTLYGLTNQQAIQYLSYLMSYSMDTDSFGFMNSPAIRDEKRAQSEIAAIAMKKVIEIDASYYQGTSDAIARRLILGGTVTTTIIN